MGSRGALRPAGRGTTGGVTPAPVFRAPMRARTLDLPAGAGAEHGLAHDLVGIGDALPRRPRSLEAAVEAAAREHGEKAGRLLERFAAAPDGAFVWTRDRQGAFHLGRLDGPWRYADDAPARETGIHHVRPARWLDRPFFDDDVPAGIAATFARGGRNFQRVHDEAAVRRTAELWG